MKLIYIANARIPTEKAHGLQIMKMCESFAKDGNDLELIIPRRINSIKQDPFDYYGVARIFKIKKLPCLDLIPLRIGHLGLWIESASFGLFVLFQIFFKKANIFYTRDKFFLFLSLFKKNLIFETHTFPKHYFLYSSFLKRLRGIVVITHKLKGLLTEGGVSPDKILVAPDGVDLEEFDIEETQEECRQKLGLPRDKKVILYAGHLYEWKGAAILLEAARSPRFSIVDSQGVIFVFVGGTEKDIIDFKGRAADLNNVMVVGQRPHHEIPYWLKAADVLVLPNSSKEEISKYWTSPMKMFEYMASKKPLVASDLPSIREILNANNAVLVRPDDPQNLAGGITRVLADKDLAEKISTQAFKDVQNYSWRGRVSKIYGFFNSNQK